MHRKLTKLFTRSVKRNTSHEPRATSHAPAGFTLTEVVAASALLIAAMVPILKAFTAANLSTTNIERKTRSLMLAQDKLDEIKARSIYSYSSSYTENNTSLDGSYLGSVSDTGSGSDLRTVTISVGFDLNGDNTLASDEIEVTLATRLARRWNSG